MNTVQTVGYIVCVAAILGGFVCGFIVLVNMFRTVANFENERRQNQQVP